MKKQLERALKLFLVLVVCYSCTSQQNVEAQDGLLISNNQNYSLTKSEVYLRTNRVITFPDGKIENVSYSDSVLLYFSIDTLYKIHHPYSCDKGINYSINDSTNTLSVHEKPGWQHFEIKKANNEISIFSSFTDNTQFEDVYKSIEMDSMKISSIIKSRVNWTSFQKKWTIESGNLKRINCELKTILKNGLNLSIENEKNFSFRIENLLYKTPENREYNFQFVDGGRWYLNLNHSCNSKNCSSEISFECP